MLKTKRFALAYLQRNSMKARHSVRIEIQKKMVLWRLSVVRPQAAENDDQSHRRNNN